MRITILLITALILTGCTTSEHQVINGSGQVLGANDHMPKIISMPPPVYPTELVQAGVKGIVVVEFVVAKDGSVNSPKIIESPDPRLSVFAEAAVLKFKCEPGIKNGEAVACRMRQPVEFGIN